MFYQRVFLKGMKLQPLHELKAVGGGWVTLVHTYSGGERVLEGVDAVVLVPLYRSQDVPYRELKGKVEQLHRIGDYVAPAWCSRSYTRRRCWAAHSSERHRAMVRRQLGPFQAKGVIGTFAVIQNFEPDARGLRV